MTPRKTNIECVGTDLLKYYINNKIMFKKITGIVQVISVNCN